MFLILNISTEMRERSFAQEIANFIDFCFASRRDDFPKFMQSRRP